MKRWKRFMILVSLVIVTAGIIAVGCSLMGPERSSPQTEQSEQK